MSVTEGDNGSALICCHAGCEAGAIVRALGLDMRDLFADAPSRAVTKPPKVSPPRGFPTWKAALAKAIRDYGQPVTWHEYRLADGAIVGGVARFRTTDGGKDFRQASTTDGGKTWSPTGFPTPRPLLYVSDVLAADTVLVVEGERCADVLRPMGYVATTSPGGGKAADKADWSPLAGRRVVILPDHDTTGVDYARDVTRFATAAGAADVRIVRLADHWPACPEGGDVADWIEDRGDAAEPADIRAALEEIISAAPIAPAPLTAETIDDDTTLPTTMTVGTAAPASLAAAVDAIRTVDQADRNAVAVLSAKLLARAIPKGDDASRMTAEGILRAMFEALPDNERPTMPVTKIMAAAIAAREEELASEGHVPGIMPMADGGRVIYVPADGLELTIIQGDPSKYVLQCPAWERYGRGGRVTMTPEEWGDPKKSRCAINRALPGLCIEPVGGYWRRCWEGAVGERGTAKKPAVAASPGLRAILEREAMAAGRWREETDPLRHRMRRLLSYLCDWMDDARVADGMSQKMTLPQWLDVYRTDSQAMLWRDGTYYFRPDKFQRAIEMKFIRTDDDEYGIIWDTLPRIVGVEKLKEVRPKYQGRNLPRYHVLTSEQVEKLRRFTRADEVEVVEAAEHVEADDDAGAVGVAAGPGR